MDSFYLIVACVAILLLILLLTIIGMMMSKQNKLDVYPPYQSQCPDYWGIRDSGLCVANNSTSPNGLPANYKQDDSKEKVRLNKIIVTSSGGTYYFDFSGNTLCDNKTWANSRNIEWDGVSNSATCP